MKEKQLITFLRKHPNPKDSKVHKWAISHGYQVDTVEAGMYKLATKYAKEVKK